MKNSYKKKFNLLKRYFIYSDQKLFAWTVLLSLILATLALVALTILFPWLFAGIWSALAAKAVIPLLIAVGKFMLMGLGYATISAFKNYLMGKLSIRWRDWLTKRMTQRLMSKHRYLELKRCGSAIDNIPQRVQDDINTVVDSSLALGFTFLQSSLTMGYFLTTLWIIGGTLSFVVLGTNFFVPGYLMWVALLATLTIALVTHFIGKSLAKKNVSKITSEADFRQQLDIFFLQAENIAQENAENYYYTSLKNKVNDINEVSSSKLHTQTRVKIFQDSAYYVTFILPYLAAAPLYLSGQFELAQVMQIGMSFQHVNFAAEGLIYSYENISNFNTSLNRLIQLEEGMQQNGILSNPKLIEIKLSDKKSIKVKSLNISAPELSNPRYLASDISFTLNPNEHVFIQGEKGLGKSTLFKIIANQWLYGNGSVRIPSNKTILFLPQRPSMPHATLKGVLAFPEPDNAYTDKAYIAALKSVRMDKFISDLSVRKKWHEQFSLGEQQCIAVARAVLKKPDWLFMDEATASVDEESEALLYKLVTNLEETTVISIAHRNTVKNFHHRFLIFKADTRKKVTIEAMNNPSYLDAQEITSNSFN